MLGTNGTIIRDAELPNAPDFSGNYLFRYTHPAYGGDLAFQIDGAYYGDQFLEVTNGLGTEQESYNVSNARITYSNQHGLALIGWVKNFTDEEYKTYTLDFGNLGVTSFYAPPITYGVSLRQDF